MFLKLRLWLVSLLTPTVTEDPKHAALMERVHKVLSKNSDKNDKHRAKLAGLIFPELVKDVVTANGVDRFEVDSKDAKAWAEAMASTIGFLAAISVTPHKVDRAIEEITAKAKSTAKFIAQLKSAKQPKGNLSGLQEASADADSTPSNGAGVNNNGSIDAAKRDALQEARSRYIGDLEAQAELTQDPGAKRALQAMADILKREQDLDKDASGKVA